MKTRRQKICLRRKVLPLILAAAFVSGPCLYPPAAYGAEAEGPGPAEEEKEPEYDEATLARLEDNVLEYDEIPDLIHKYNSSIQQNWDDFNKDMTDTAKIQTELLSQARLMKELKESAEDEGDAEDAAYYAQQEQSYKSMAKRYTDTMEDYDKPKATKSLRQQERQLVKGAETLMFSYNSMRLQRENQEKLRDVYQAKYDLAQAEVQAGTKTALDAQSAKNQLLSAESALISLDSSLAKVKSSLCVMTGWSAGADPEIGSIPEADAAVMNSWDVSADTAKAIGNNQTLIGQRTESYSKSTAGITNHLRVVEQGEQQLTIKMQSLYQTAVDKKNAYDAAMAGYQSAAIAKNVADQKYRLNMLSRSDYLEAELTYLQKKAARDSANIAFYEALKAYEWAVDGFTDIE